MLQELFPEDIHFLFFSFVVGYSASFNQGLTYSIFFSDVLELIFRQVP